MGSKGWIDVVRVCALGAINGLFSGAAFGMLNDFYLRSSAQPRSYDVTVGNSIILMAAPIPPNFGGIVFWCVLIFTFVSYGMHRLWLKRQLSPLIMWQVIGIVGFALLLAAGFARQESYWASLPRWTVLICLADVVIINFIFGVVVDAAANLYRRA